MRRPPRIEQKVIYYHFHPSIDHTMNEILQVVKTTQQRMESMFEDLVTKVAALKTASDSAEALLDGIKAKLDELIASGGLTEEDKARLQEISTSIENETSELSAAVARNTPSS